MSLNEVQELTLRRGWRNNMSPKAIGRMIDRSPETVHYYARKWELPKRNILKGRPNQVLNRNLAVPLTGELLEAVRAKAVAEGIGMGTMVRGWIEERLYVKP